jgi:hypothetical protein
MIEKDDWRLNFGKEPEFYKKYKWVLKKWSQTRDNSDHDHCEFCNAKFMDTEGPNILPQGWTDENETYWICEGCFEDFRKMYQWDI